MWVDWLLRDMTTRVIGVESRAVGRRFQTGVVGKEPSGLVKGDSVWDRSMLFSGLEWGRIGFFCVGPFSSEDLLER